MIRLYVIGGVVLAVIAGGGALYWTGRDAGTDAARRGALEADRDTNRRINDADTGSGQPDGDRDWLRDRGQR